MNKIGSGSRHSSLVEQDTSALKKFFLTKSRTEAFSVLNSIIQTKDVERVAKATVLFYERSDMMLEMVSWALRHEIDNTNSGDILFRDDNLTTRIIFEYMQIFGRVYIRRTLEPGLTKALNIPLRSSYSGEKRTLKTVSKLCTLIFESIVNSVPIMPNNIKNILGMVAAEVNTKFPTHTSLVVGVFLYFRLLGPAIVSPHCYGLTHEQPNMDVQRTLVMVSKILQRMTNKTLFEKEDPLSDFNSFIENNKPIWDQFLGSLINQQKLPNDYSPLPNDIYNAAWNILEAFVVVNKEPIKTAWHDVLQGESQVEVEALFPLIEASRASNVPPSFVEDVNNWISQTEREAMAVINMNHKQRSKEIEKLLREEAKSADAAKLLLLGAGDAGKSTIVRQMKLLHTDDFNDKELRSNIPIIMLNVLQGIQSLIFGCSRIGGNISEANEPTVRFLRTLLELTHEQLHHTVKDIKALWQDPAIQRAYARSTEFQLPSSWPYWIENIDRLADLNYVPTPQDIVRIRVATTGVVETCFRLNDFPIRLVDVGGQRSERRKWIHCFSDVTAIIYIIAINEYDLSLFEEESVNRLQESMNLFKDVCNEKWLKDKPIIVFLNKSDLFKQKIAKVDLNGCFPDYTGGCDYDKAIEYLVQKLYSLRGADDRPFYYHITCATDTQNVSYVFNACKDILLRGMLDDTFQ